MNWQEEIELTKKSWQKRINLKEEIKLTMDSWIRRLRRLGWA